METIDQFSEQIKNLAPAPRILTELLPLTRQHNADAHRVIELITYDTALTAKVLRCCNSAAAGLAEPVQSVSEAVTRLGFNEIYRLVAVVVGQTTLGGIQVGYGMPAGDLWRHSAVTAVASRSVAHELGADENTVFTCGLLHDIGKILLNTALMSAYSAVEGKIVDEGESFVEAEKSILGVEHAELGGRVLEKWNFPENLVQAVWHHHDPIKAGPHAQTAAFVYMGDMLAHAMGYGDGYHAMASRGRAEVLRILEITPGEIDKFILLTDAALKDATWFFSTEPAPATN